MLVLSRRTDEEIVIVEPGHEVVIRLVEIRAIIRRYYEGALPWCMTCNPPGGRGWAIDPPCKECGGKGRIVP